MLMGRAPYGDGDIKGNIKWKIYFLFLLWILRYSKVFTLFITVKTIMKMNLRHTNKLEIKIYKISKVVHVLQATQSLVKNFICCFGEDGKEMYQELERRCTAAIALFLKPFVMLLLPLPLWFF